jgi:hypothetical protein
MSDPTVEQLKEITVLIASTWDSMLSILLAPSPTDHDRIIDYYLSDHAHAETLIQILSAFP